MGRYDYVPGINTPYDTGINISSPAILDTGANNTYVNDRRLITNLTSGSASVKVADGSHHPILASGNLVSLFPLIWFQVSRIIKLESLLSLILPLVR